MAFFGKGYHAQFAAQEGNQYWAFALFEGRILTLLWLKNEPRNTVQIPSGLLKANSWHHMVYVRGAEMKIYIDGEDVSINQINDGWERDFNLNEVLSSTPLRFGRRDFVDSGPDSFFNGSIDDIIIYDRILTDNEINQLFTQELDSDRDGITDSDEVSIYGTNPQLADTDGDQLSDGFELGFGRYEFMEGDFTWKMAKADAVSKGGNLVTIINENEWNSILYFIGDKIEGKDVWAGGTDEGTEGIWRWITGENWTFERWGPLNPSNSTASDPGGEHFLHLEGLTSNLLWNDWPNSAIRPIAGYIFEIGYFTDPLNADTDGDGFSDGEEWLSLGTVPTVFDDPPMISILQDIPNKQAVLGTTVTFEIEAEGENLSYQWYFNGDAMNRETNPVLTLPSIRFSDEGEYYVEISNGSQTIQRRKAFLSVVEFRLDVYAAVELEWQTQAGLTYQLQSSMDLMNWEDLEDPFVGTGETIAKLLSTRQSGARYFRLERRE